MSDAAGFVCGFADEATAVVGLAWSLGGGRGGVLVREGATHAADAEVDLAGDGAEVRLIGEGASCEAAFTARPELHQLPPAPAELVVGEPRAAICSVRARLADGGDRAIECAGHLTRWDADPLDGVALFRHLAIPGPDGSVLLANAARPEGATNHADEGVAAWQLGPEGGAVGFAEAMVSTQYDGEGFQVRTGLELWRSERETPPVRAAGWLVRRTVARLDAVTAAVLHTSAEGSEGIGDYLIWRR
jgi:hypothetical protein